MRARTSFRAWIMSVSGAKSIDSSAAPRTDFDRTRTTPSTMPTTSSIGRVTATSTSFTASPGVCAMTTIRGKGDFRIDAAGHAEHRHDAEGGQQSRGQDDQPEVRPGPGDQVDPARRARASRNVSVGGQAHLSTSFSAAAGPSETWTGVSAGRL